MARGLRAFRRVAAVERRLQEGSWPLAAEEQAHFQTGAGCMLLWSFLSCAAQVLMDDPRLANAAVRDWLREGLAVAAVPAFAHLRAIELGRAEDEPDAGFLPYAPTDEAALLEEAAHQDAADLAGEGAVENALLEVLGLPGS